MDGQSKQVAEYSSRLDEYDKKFEENSRKFGTLLTVKNTRIKQNIAVGTLLLFIMHMYLNTNFTITSKIMTIKGKLLT